MSVGQGNDKTEREEQPRVCFMNACPCSPDCVAYDQKATFRCELLMSVKKIAESLGAVSTASGMYAQTAEKAWHL